MSDTNSTGVNPDESGEEQTDEHTLIHVICDGCGEVDVLAIVEHPRESAQTEIVSESQHTVADRHADRTGHHVEVGVTEGTPEQIRTQAKSMADSVDGAEPEDFTPEMVPDGGLKPGQQQVDGEVYEYPFRVVSFHGELIRDELDTIPPFLNQREIDVLASELETRFENGIDDGMGEQTLVEVLRKLPDTEYGRGTLPAWVVRGSDECRMETDGGIDTTTLQLTEGMGGASIQADLPQADIQIGASDAALRALLDDLLAYFEGEAFSFEGRVGWRLAVVGRRGW